MPAPSSAPNSAPHSKWDLETVIRVAWGDMDAFAHVNHTVYLRWFETARIEWFTKVDFPEDGRRGPILKTASAVYEAQVKYPDTVTVRVRAEPPGRTSVKLVYEVFSEASQAIVATGDTVVVLVEDGKPSVIDDALRQRIAGAAGART
jgi:acyl-CoA thioester hydrolase